MRKGKIIGVSIGDPAGIGPEIILKSIIKLKKDIKFQPLLYGKINIFEFYNNLFHLGLRFYSVRSINNIIDDDNAIPVFDVLPDIGDINVLAGKPDINGAKIAIESIREAALSAMRGEISALVTAPIYKKGITSAGLNFKGHTDFLAHLTKTPNYAMMLAGGGLKVVLVTIHIPFCEVVLRLNSGLVFDTIKIAHESFSRFGIKNPKIAVCALNPHAGEEGLMGNEESTIIKPAVDKALSQNINVTGIFPADTIFWDALNGKSDVVIALYHDQGLIPVKALAFDSGVNVTLGLPIIRTSPDHGTAFNIAGKNIANPNSMIEAVKLAIELSGK